jgi:peptidyl-prolyl cis-trans isomerase C
MKWLKEPLVLFILLGAALTLVYSVASGAFATDESKTVAMDASEIELLAANWERQWQRPPTEAELRGLIDARVREEVLYRAAQSMGLDRNDIVVRRRMVQKMELLSQDLAMITDPPEADLRAFFEENREDYRVPPRVSFRHIYFNLDRRGYEGADTAARELLAEIRAGDPDEVDVAQMGDRFMLAYEYTLRSPIELQQAFGSRFAEEVIELEPGWHGPIGSGYGTHLVKVTDRVESALPEFERVRERVLADYGRTRRERANELLLEGLSADYSIEIDEAAIQARSLEAITGQGG